VTDSTIDQDDTTPPADSSTVVSPGSSSGPSSVSSSSVSSTESATDQDVDAAADQADAGAQQDGGSVQGADEGSGKQQTGGAAARLEEEGDVAADYLEELLDILDLDGDIDIDVENGRASVSVVVEAASARSLQRLVGTDGEVLEALQELTRLAVQARTGERTRLMLDVAGFRADRRKELEKVAAQAIETVRSGGTPVSLPPMSPFERKVVHDCVAAAGLRSESEGEESGRHVVVLPATA